MRHRTPAPHPVTDTRPNRSPRRSNSATSARLRREHARNLAWFSL